MRYGSVCSGVEAASLAWEPLGWQPAWFAEIEPFPAAVLAHHWPQVPNLGDMTTLAARSVSGEVEAPDVLVGGTPCQAFAFAGQRQSLADVRGSLTLEFVRIFNAIDDVRQLRGQRPAIAIWENVPGVLNTRDNAFGCFLGALCGHEGALQPSGGKWTNAGMVFGQQRAIAWRVLDAQYFGVAQRRERVFVVASAGDIDPAGILFECQSVRRDTAPRRDTKEDAPERTTNSARAYGGGARASIDVAVTLTAHGRRLDFDSETFVVNGRQDPVISHIAQPLGCQNNGMDNVMISGGDVRRLMPIEWERLQGMPDGHTQVPWRGKPAKDCPDGPRYKAIGNSMCVPVMRWIGQRIQAVGAIKTAGEVAA